MRREVATLPGFYFLADLPSLLLEMQTCWMSALTSAAHHGLTVPPLAVDVCEHWHWELTISEGSRLASTALSAEQSTFWELCLTWPARNNCPASNAAFMGPRVRKEIKYQEASCLIYMYLSTSIYLSDCLSVCLSICLSIHPSIHLSIHLYIYLSISIH